VSSDKRVRTVADKYAISDYAATYIVRAVELAKANDESGITDLGLTSKDFEKMMKGSQLDADKLNAVSAKLLMSTEAVEQMIFDIKNDIDHAH
jgi:hypothetical protein